MLGANASLTFVYVLVHTSNYQFPALAAWTVSVNLQVAFGLEYTDGEYSTTKAYSRSETDTSHS